MLKFILELNQTKILLMSIFTIEGLLSLRNQRIKLLSVKQDTSIPRIKTEGT